MHNNWIEVKGFSGTFLGVLRAFLLAQWAVTTRERNAFDTGVELVLHQTEMNRAKLLLMMREFKPNGVSLERLPVSGMENQLYSSGFSKFGEYELRLVASEAIERMKAVK